MADTTRTRTNPFDLSGQTAMVTGATGGLGTRMCLALAAAGANVAVHHLGQEKAAGELAEQIRAIGVRATIVSGDVADWDAARAFVNDAEANLAPLDILVNNAGFMEPAPLVEMTLETWRRTLRVDLDGVFVTSRHVLESMLRRRRGVVINVSSQLAFKGARDYASYSAAKAGVVGLTRAMAREVGPEVRVNAIAPGPIKTPMTEATFDSELERARTAGSVAGRMGEADEVAPAVVYLASNGASYLHGQTLHINGGGVMA